tara:strand:- start:168 stop:476 length:309 start_codon:yes stop_codon:yes gene_type:complete
MVDRDDDLKIGVKSTAIAFGNKDLLAIAILQLLTLWFLVQAHYYLNWHWPMTIALATVATLFVQQFWSARSRDRAACFNAFLNNHYVGLAIFVGLVIEYQLY